MRPLSDNDIDRAIQDWNGKIESKHAVVRYMKDHARKKDTAAWLAHEFDGGDGKTPFAIRPESPNGTVLPWPKVQRRIAQLIKEDRFYTQVEQDNLDDVDPIAIRETLAQRGIVDGHVVDPEKLDNAPFIQQAMRDVEAIFRESVQADEPEQPAPHNSRVLVSDEEYAAARGTLRERTSYDPAVPPYHVGDTVYLDDRPHQITELRDDTVQLLPTGMSYPIYRAERQEQFEQLPEQYSHLYMAMDGKLVAVICIEDPLRVETAEVIRELKHLGIHKVVMMTGDSDRIAANIAQKAGVDAYYSEVLPEDKANFVEQEKKAGHKVIMVGDGINDSPALSAADVGIAISEGAEIAREIADVTIAADDLREIITLKKISNALMKRIDRNYKVIVGFNTALILFGVGGVLQPTMSALLHNTSTILISLKSMENLLEE